MKRGIHPDNWLAAADFTPEGRTLVIEKVEEVEIDANKYKTVVFFKDEPKGLVLNEVNERIIAKNTGHEDTRQWKGYHITPYSTSIIMRGELTPCIRVKIEVGTVAFKEASA